MRILAVANWDYDRTAVPWARQRLAALEAAGARVDVLSVDCVNDKRGYVELYRQLRRRIDETRYDLVTPLYGSMLGFVCALQRRVPVVMSFAGSDLNGDVNPGRLGLQSLSVVFSQVTAALSAGVTVGNTEMKQRLWWPPARARAAVFPDGLDTDRFRPVPRDEARRALGWPPDDLRILFVASNPDQRPYKRVQLARDAVALIPGATLVIAGHVPFDEMPLYYPAADALLLTSINEGAPNCVKEALACGTPVVTTDVGDVKEVITGLTNCRVVDVHASPEQIAEAVRAVTRDGRRCPEGPEKMAREYSLRAVVARYLRVFDDAIARAHA